MTRHPLCSRLGGIQGGCGKSRPTPRFEPHIVQLSRPAGCVGECVDVMESKWHEDGENGLETSFVIRAVNPVSLRRARRAGGARWRSWLRHCATRWKVAGSIPLGVSPGSASASNRNEYQEYFLGGKGGRCVGLTTLPAAFADCLEIWESHPPSPSL
jgi:hypothetical protein